MKSNIMFDQKGVQIYKDCFESYPCKHYVSINNSQPHLLGAKRIIVLLQKRKLRIPTHFKKYLKN